MNTQTIPDQRAPVAPLVATCSVFKPCDSCRRILEVLEAIRKIGQSK